MDTQTFDRLTRLISSTGSRRTAWRALLATALLGATTRNTAVARCRNGKPACGSDCCPSQCFRNGSCEVCCTKENNLVICGNTCCKSVDDRGNPLDDPCNRCTPPPKPSDLLCTELIVGSYRRR